MEPVMEPEATPPDGLDAGMRAAFGGAPNARPSLLHVLQRMTGSRLDLHLRGNDESDAPVKIDDEAKALRDPSGRYQVLGEIGRGGVGVVYKGRDQDLGRDVAMKVLRPEYASRPEILERFIEEAQIGGQLQHPGIVPVYELGLQHGERPYFAMKLVKGETLAVLLARRANPGDDRRRFLAVFEQICQTLAYAHARNVVHRDLKPANVMIGSFGEVQVVDWGFAKVLQAGRGSREAKPAAPAASVIATVRSDPARGSQSVAGSMLGTPAYMPPEQALGDVENLDERSDVFGLGAILCEILTGGPPYLEADGDLILQAARADMSRVHARLDQSGADAPLVDLCRSCLAPARAARPAAGTEVAKAIAAYLSSVEERARQAQLQAAEAKGRARTTLVAAVAAVLLLALAGGGYAVFTQQARERSERAGQRVAAAVNATNVLLAEVKARDASVAEWDRALDAAERAHALAQEADIATTARAETATLLDSVRLQRDAAATARAAAAKNAAMRERLADARFELDDYSARVRTQLPLAKAQPLVAARYQETYSAAFAAYLDGRQLTSLDVDAARQALAGPLSVELAVAIDDWVHWPLRMEVGSPEGEQARLLQTVAMSLDPDPLRNRLRAMLGGGAPDLASVKALRREFDVAKLPPISLHLLARAFDLAGSRSDAVQTLRLACNQHPTDFPSAFDLASVLHMAGELTGAEAHFRIARALRPESALVHSNLAALLREQGRFDEAAASIRTALAGDDRNAILHLILGLILRDQGQRVDAERSLRQAIALDPGYGKAHNDLGSLLMDLGRQEEAAAALRRAIELQPDFSDSHTNLGDLLADQGRIDEAIASYRTALQLQPNDLVTCNSLSIALHQQGDDAGAVEILQRGLAIDPNHAPLNFNLAMRLFEECRYEAALAAMRRAEATWTKNTDDFSRQWLANVQKHIASLQPEVDRLDELLAIARGERAAATPMEIGAAAEFALGRGDFALALRALERGFAAHPGLLETASCRYHAARSAVQQAARQAPAGEIVPDGERTQLRERARAWLLDELRRWRAQLGDNPDVRRVVLAAQRDPLLAGVRDAAALAALPTQEAADWRALWQQVAALLRDG
jgi:eukaryotic-like serine/threonine-protein kinase